jgi:hypothetical protein
MIFIAAYLLGAWGFDFQKAQTSSSCIRRWLIDPITAL